MTIHVALQHRTSYRYERPIMVGPQIVRLRPAPHCRTRVLSYSLTVEPKDHFVNWQQDPFANWQARLVFPERINELIISVDLVAEMAVLNPFDFFISPEAEQFPFTYESGLKQDLTPFLQPIEPGPLLRDYLDRIDRHAERTIDFLVALNQKLANDISYLIRMEPGVQTPEETLGNASGSCRDSAWLLVQILRHLGLAARFTSGYLIQLKPDQKSLDGPSGAEADFTDLHAWCEVYLPGAGWIGLDPTSGLLAGEGHLPIAATPEPSSAAPVTGAHEPSSVEFDHQMSVKRVLETPRVTLPYSDTQWAAIVNLGDQIDAQLNADDVRLTTGGEPTFIALDDRDGDEWNIDAVGPTKRTLADDLLGRLKSEFAPDGLVQHGQGKWYPGEPLPRWAFALYWRQDGAPLWQNTGLIADEDDSGASVDDAARFADELCAALGLASDTAQPAFEDKAHYEAIRDRLPPNLTPADNQLEREEDRQRLAKVFAHGLDRPTGYVLPIQAWQARAQSDAGRRRFAWRSERWATRLGKLVLLPGDSPVGFRLPLGALTYLGEGGQPEFHPLDPFAARAALPALTPTMQRRTIAHGETASSTDAGPVIRTALTIEPRDGILHIFLPPVESADAFVDLLQAIEETAEATGQKLRLEGYPPPSDYRLNTIKVTPDPGVIEVNIHPAATWREQIAITEMIYECARQSRLDTVKFMLDGRATGTGGGNHVVMGGPTPADSPFLRRPDLLGSIIRYWQNHPCLSYLFSGMFIGPTSQAPRLDEARQDQLYEMEIALAQIPSPLAGGACPPWLTDRILRHLLVDLTGNTHRAEICIDKLYSPDGPAGRLGLVEFRAFEMPPHARMSLAQQLLLRALIAWFWRQPYQGQLIRHGTALHDRFMLPYFLEQDLHAVLADLAGAGMVFEPAWFAPHLEFRFPLYGQFGGEGVSVELRAALEPWHVLGEEGTVGGTARYVDSSLERLEVRLEGAGDARLAVTCNGYLLPVGQNLGGPDAGNALPPACGVRFRAWQPPSCLHPTIGVHSPLSFDLVDTAAGQAIAGATYHVMHPAGRNYETMPVNDFEAEGRRLSRFESGRHHGGGVAVRQPKMHPEFASTLDLRRQ